MKYYVLKLLLTLLFGIFIIGSLIYAAFSINFWLGIFSIFAIIYFVVWLVKQINKHIDKYESNIS